MRITVVGAGAVGGYFGGVLARHGEDVTLIARGEHAEVMREHGLNVFSHWGDFTVHPRVVSVMEEAGDTSLLLFCVKLYSGEEAASKIGCLVGEDTLILTLQNGIGSGEMLASMYGWERVMEGAVYIEAIVKEPGVVEQIGSAARIEVGARDARCRRTLPSVISVLDKPGIQTTAIDDIYATLWTKLVSVGAFGTVLAASRASLPEVLSMPEGEATLRAVMQEIATVARAVGVSLPADVVERKLEEGVAEAESYRASLHVDLMRGRPLEIEGLLGEVVRLGRGMGVPVPVSAALVTVLHKFKEG